MTYRAASAFALVLLLPLTAISTALPLDGASTFVGWVDSEALLGLDGYFEGFPYGPGAGSIDSVGGLAPGSTLEVVGLELAQEFIAWADCGCNAGTAFEVSLELAERGSLLIDSEGRPRGRLGVVVAALQTRTPAALDVVGGLWTPSRLYVVGAFVFEDPGSPLALLQGVRLVPEPGIPSMLLVAGALGMQRVYSKRRSMPA